MYAELIKRKINYILKERTNKIGRIHCIEKDDERSWVIKSKRTGKILSSHSTKEKAKKALSSIMKFSSLLPKNKEKEIIVWMRQRPELDKDQLREFVSDKFDIQDTVVDSLYYEAFPDSLSKREEHSLKTLEEETSERGISIPINMIDDIIQFQLDGDNDTSLNVYDELIGDDITNTLYVILHDALSNRKLI